jgi:hypothetical protein
VPLENSAWQAFLVKDGMRGETGRDSAECRTEELFTDAKPFLYSFREGYE